MANELQISALPQKTIYFLVRSVTGTIWNGSTYVAYATADLGSYDIPATEQGTASGYYTANMPTSSAGVYYVLAKEQAGGSPAESDLLVGAGEIQWSGSAVLPLSSMGSVVLTTANKESIADTIFSRDMDQVEASAAIHSLCTAILKMVSKFDLAGANAVIYRTDGTTPHASQSRTTDATLVATKTLGVSA